MSAHTTDRPSTPSTPSALTRLDSVVVAVTLAMRAVAAVVILGMTLTTVYDVIMRYVFAMPTTWALTLNSAGILAATFLTLPHLAAVHGHIEMDLFYDRFSARTRRVCDIVTGVATLVFALLLAWLGWRATATMWESGLLTSGNFSLPLWAVYGLVLVGGVGLTIVTLLSPWRTPASAASGSGVTADDPAAEGLERGAV